MGSLASQSCPCLRNTRSWDLPYCLVFKKKVHTTIQTIQTISAHGYPTHKTVLRIFKFVLHLSNGTKKSVWYCEVSQTWINEWMAMNGNLQFIVLHSHVMLLEHRHTSSVSFVSARKSRYPKPWKHPKGRISCGCGRLEKKHSRCRRKNKTRLAQQLEQRYPTVPGRRLLTVTVSSQLYSCLCSS